MMTQAKNKQWWQISASNQTAEILLYEEIDDLFGIDAKQFMDDLNALGDDITNIDLRINSPGGSVFQGIAIYNALKRHDAYVKVYVDGVALSMASGIAMAGDEIEMAENAIMMIHNPQALAVGDEQELRRRAEMLRTTRDALVKAYSAKSGRSEQEIGELMAEEKWMTADEAYDLGFCDSINECKKMAASFDLNDFNVPSRLQGRLTSLFSTEPKQMASDPKAGAPKTATLQELEAINADAEFIVNCLKAEMTLDAAKNKLIEDQQSTIKDLVDELEKVRNAADSQAKIDTLRRQGTSTVADPQQSSEPKTAPAKTPEPAAQPARPVQQPPADPAASASVGNDPINVGTTPAKDLPFNGDAYAFFKKAKAEAKAELEASGRKYQVNDMLRLVHEKYPGLDDAMRQQAES